MNKIISVKEAGEWANKVWPECVKQVYVAHESVKWVGLTDEERHACTQSPFAAENYRAIEAKLKEKNA